ncbi:MAG: glycosyltransferase [Actinomycetota bacterium]
MIGTRGYPSYYGGFETAVRRLAPYLVDAGWEVTVYGRPGATRTGDPGRDIRVRSRTTWVVETVKLSTLSYGLTAAIDAGARRPDVALVFNVANGYFLPLLKARGIPTLVNVDGIEWERAKWSRLAQSVFRNGARLTARWASGLVFDAKAIADYWKWNFDVGGLFIPYGGDIPPALPVPEGLSHRGYVLVVARCGPENSIPEFFDAVPRIATKYPVVVVGCSGYGGELDEAAKRLSDSYPSVSWLGHVSDDALLLALWQHAGVYFHGHSVGGTNPALVQAMAAGAPVLARDTPYNREVLGPTGRFTSATAEEIADAIIGMMSGGSQLDAFSRENISRAQQRYSWSTVCRDYESALRALLPCVDAASHPRLGESSGTA